MSFHGFGFFFHLIARFGLPSIFISHVIENIGIPFPTEGAFLVSQRLIETGRYSFWFMYAFMVLAQVTGAVLAYFLGREIDGWLSARLKNHEGYQKAHAAMHRWYEKFGSVTVLATRLIGYVRPWSSLVAGAAEFPFWPFLLWTVVGSALFVYPTMKLTSVVFLLWRRSPLLHLLISLAFLLSFGALLIYGVVRRRMKKSNK
ncbi:MAG TPA: VTT domain-containing protein [Candidatus Saccharimonadales bacterium]|nr:VTT domain-containing protein [Candidatus Saccharimonadales bacterium]